MQNLRELMVGRRGEAPLVPPYILCNFKLDGAVAGMILVTSIRSNSLRILVSDIGCVTLRCEPSPP